MENMVDEWRAWLPAMPQLLRLGLRAPTLLPAAPNGPDTLLRRAARRFGGRDALLFGERRWTWSDFDSDVDRWAHALKGCGLQAGDSFALLMDNRPSFLLIFHAANRIGAIPALINTSLHSAALAHVLRAVDFKTWIVGSEHLAKLETLDTDAHFPETCVPILVVADEDVAQTARSTGYPVVPPLFSASRDLEKKENVQWLTPSPWGKRVPVRQQHMQDLCCYIYTSGTTGFPKAALIRNQRLAASGTLFGHLMHRVSPGDVIYIPLPLYHTNALGLAWGACLATGATAALRRRFSVTEFWDDVQRYRATSMISIGELCRYLVQAPPHPKERAHRLRVVVGNGAREDVARTFAERFGVETIREFYGSTEGNAFTLNYLGVPGRIGKLRSNSALLRCDPSTGTLLRGADGWCMHCQPGETGLLVGRLSRVIAYDGYTDAEASRKKVIRDVFEAGDQWFNTGDLLQLHAGRWLSFVDRLGDTYRWKGENVSTAEVESLLARAPGVVECIVVGVAIPRTEGRAGLAVLRVTEAFSLSSFESYIHARVPTFQQPTFLRLVTRPLATTGTYKLQKSAWQALSFAPDELTDSVFFQNLGSYVRVDEDLYRRLQMGELSLDSGKDPRRSEGGGE